MVLTAAIAALFEDHVPPVAVLVSVELAPTHKVVLPEIAATLGKAFTVIVVAAEIAEQPLLLLTVSV